MSSLKRDERLSAIKMLIASYQARRGDPPIACANHGISRLAKHNALNWYIVNRRSKFWILFNKASR